MRLLRGAASRRRRPQPSRDSRGARRLPGTFLFSGLGSAASWPWASGGSQSFLCRSRVPAGGAGAGLVHGGAGEARLAAPAPGWRGGGDLPCPALPCPARCGDVLLRGWGPRSPCSCIPRTLEAGIVERARSASRWKVPVLLCDVPLRRMFAGGSEAAPGAGYHL